MTPMCSSRSWRRWRSRSPRALQFFFTSTSYSQVDQIVLRRRRCAAARLRRARRQARGVATVIANPFGNMAVADQHPAAAARPGRPAAADRLRSRDAELRMIRINLLPHREQKRQARQRQFVSRRDRARDPGTRRRRAGPRRLRRRRSRTSRAATSSSRTRSRSSTSRSKEIDKLREQTQALSSRKQVVETLQTNRTEAVHLLDQMVRQLPDGIYSAHSETGRARRLR